MTSLGDIIFPNISEEVLATVIVVVREIGTVILMGENVTVLDTIGCWDVTVEMLEDRCVPSVELSGVSNKLSKTFLLGISVRD